jgi:hypothetical protein
VTTDNLSPGQFNADQVIAPDVGRVTARKDNTQDSIRLAIFRSSTTGKPQHVYQTHYGWEVDAFLPPGGQAHYRAEPTGRVLRVTRDIRSGETSEEHVGTYRVVRKTKANRAGLERRQEPEREAGE